jgi:uncharacterized repeat protein (TIGR03803 family)
MKKSGLVSNFRVLVALTTILSVGYEVRAKEFSLQVLHVFQSPGPGTPESGVLRTSDGSLYGTTREGDALEGGNGWGTIYRIAPDGQITVLTVFNGAIGYYGTAGLVQGNDGNFYGSPETGGPDGAMTSFFRITPAGNFTSICSLYGETNGYDPYDAMIPGRDGNFYGTMRYGGAGYNETNGTSNGGTVFRLTSAGEFTLLNSFVGTNGIRPVGRLMQSTNGNIYGTTILGGQFGFGTVFGISPAGDFHTIFSFAGTNGAEPVTGLVEGDDGWLYGMTEGDINSYGHGTIYKVSSNGDFAIVASFNGTNGRYPVGNLVKDEDGQLYGVAVLGGTFDGGTVFRLTTNNEIEVIASFNNDTGQWPTELTKGSDGNIYGTTSVSGGPFGNGTVFRLAQVPEIYSSCASNGVMNLTWSAFTGGVYRVEYKGSLSDTNWNLLSDRITATTNSASFADSPATEASRFYRVCLLPW